MGRKWLFAPQAHRFHGLTHGCSSMPEISNKIIRKGLAFLRKQSGTLVSFRALTGSGILPRRLHRRGGASVVRRNAALNRTEDLNVKDCQEATICVIGNARSCCEAPDPQRS